MEVPLYERQSLKLSQKLTLIYKKSNFRLYYGRLIDYKHTFLLKYFNNCIMTISYNIQYRFFYNY